MTTILGLNAYHGDAAAALVVDGVLVAAAEEERFTRVKHVAGFPTQAAEWCLAQAGLRPDELDHIAVSRDPRANTGPELLRTVRHGASARYLNELLRHAGKPRDVRAALGGGAGAQVHEVEHHQAHAASAFLVSPFEDAAILSVDAFGDFASTMTATGRGSSFGVLERVLFPHSLGIFYAAFTQWLGFVEYGDEGKTMGLAAFGDPERFLKPMRDVVRLDEELFTLNLDYFLHDKEGVDMTWDEGAPSIGRIYSDKLVETFGPARAPEAELASQHQDVAAAVQRRLEEVYLHLAGQLRRRTGLPDLCLAGGVALNAVANGRLAAEGVFERIYVPPAPTDAGTAVGCAYHVWHCALGRERSYVMRHAFTGPEYGDVDVEAALVTAGLASQRLEDDALYALTAERLAQGEVVGWFQGRMELGPRALGGRSILADPRRPEMKAVLNERIKNREGFRPFGLSVRAAAAGEWFQQALPSPFMALVYALRPGKRALVPAVAHVDGSARVQTVEPGVEPRYYRLLEEFGRLTGVPLLLNTSFNENEPIVMTPAEALDTFRKTRMDLLVLGNYVLRRDASS